MAWKKLGGLAALSLAFVFGACGDDSSSGADSGSKQREVSTIYDLGACTADREGDSVYVIEKKSDYLCQKGEWIELDAENNPNSSSSAKSEPSSSSANSKNSSSSEEPDTLWIIKNKTISGYAQKGPFEKGSEVVLYELDSTTLKQTGRSFEGKVESDDGKFSIKKVTLASPYVLLKVNGRYKSELEYSSVFSYHYNSEITLIVLTDLRDRDHVNINLLTHLEYDRALYLVKEGLDVSAAKKQAETEIFNAFEIQGKFKSSEDLNIFGSSDGDAALLAVSMLMLRHLDESEFDELLTDFANDIKKDGEWNGADAKVIKTKIADWASGVDLADVRDRIMASNSVTDVPDFEKYITQFWLTIFGFGPCETATHGDLQENNNSLSSSYKVVYFCDDDKWRVAEFFELKDFGKGYFLNPDIAYDSITDSRDGHTYKIVTIGKQTWMAENLNYADDVTEGSTCFEEKNANCDFAGRLYTWNAATKLQDCEEEETCVLPEKVQGVCPEGWHLPNNEEWETLITAAGPSNAGKNLKSKTGWLQTYWSEVEDYGTDKYGFSAVPAGDHYIVFSWDNDYANFWSATETEDGDAYSMELAAISNDAELKERDKAHKYPVRCIKDSED